MEGLAQQMASGAGRSAQQIPTVEEVLQLLMEGMDPQQLLGMGVPKELLVQALQILEQQMGAGAQPSTPEMGGGLAQTMVR